MRQRWILAMAYCELVGGILILCGGWLLKQDANRHFVVFLPLVTMAAAALSLTAGGLVLRQKQSGLALSLLVQALQIVNFNVGWRYVFLAGPKMTLMLASAGVALYGGAGGLFTLTGAPSDGTLAAPGVAAELKVALMPGSLESASWAIGINLLAIYFFVRLWRLDTALTVQSGANAEARSSGAAA